jgi:hypothetical protein
VSGLKNLPLPVVSRVFLALGLEIFGLALASSRSRYFSRRSTGRLPSTSSRPAVPPAGISEAHRRSTFDFQRRLELLTCSPHIEVAGNVAVEDQDVIAAVGYFQVRFGDTIGRPVAAAGDDVDRAVLDVRVRGHGCFIPSMK